MWIIQLFSSIKVKNIKVEKAFKKPIVHLGICKQLYKASAT